MSDEVLHAEDLVQDLGAVERTARLKARWRCTPGGIRVCKGRHTEGLELRHRLSDGGWVELVRIQLDPTGKPGIRVDLKSNSTVPREHGLNECGPDPGKRIEHSSGTRQVAGEDILDKLLRVAGNPGNPAMDGQAFIAGKRRVAEGRSGGGGAGQDGWARSLFK